MSLCCLFTCTSGFPGLLATFILTDGWMDGWMDGMDGRSTFFFLAHISKTTWYFFIMVSDPHNICFYTSFGIFAEKKSECSFFQEISPKSKIPFFSKIFSRIFQISRKLLNIFSSLFLVPLEDILRHILKKISKKKSNFIFVKKFRNFFFLRQKFWPNKIYKGFPL